MKIDLIFLLKAINDAENVFIYHKHHKEKEENLRYFSRFFKVLSNEDAIIIDYPYVEGYTHKQLVKDDPISVFFNLAGFRFHFDSVVKESTHFHLKDGTQIPALKIAWPDEILDGNRRSLYRVTVHLDPSIIVKYFILGNIKGDESFAGAERVEYKGVEAIMIDISQNGIAVEIKRKINIAAGDILKLWFRLEEEDKQEIEIEGIVRNLRELPGSEIHICGIEFTPEKTAKYKRSLQKITRYIMSRNRENVSFFTVNQTISKNPFIQKIVENEVTEEFLHLLLLKKLPLSDEEYLEGYAYVSKNEKYKEKAAKALQALPIDVKEEYIERTDANHRVAYYILQEAVDYSYLKIIAGAINNQYLPVEFLLEIARNGTALMLKALLANKIKLIAYPDIMDVMQDNPKATTPIKEKIREIKNSYLQKKEAELIPETVVIGKVKEFAAPEDKESTTEIKRKTLTTLLRINRMSIQQRIRLAITGNRAERLILANDRNKVVLQAVIESPKISEDEVLILAQKKSIPIEVAAKICENKNWMRNYSILFAILKNPNMPVKKAPDFLKKLHPRELKELAMDKNTSPAVRNLARYIAGKKK